MKHRIRTFLKWFSAILFGAFLVQFILLMLALYKTWQTKDLNSELQSTKAIAGYKGLQNDWSHGLLDVNSDYRGWLTVYGTNISSPVVQTSDNEKYLNTDFNGEKNSSGTIFLDKEVDTKAGGNLIIYGHKMKDDTMFGELDKFTEEDFFTQNGIISWEEESGKHYYDVFAVMVVPGSRYSARFTDFTQWINEISNAKRKQMLETIKDKSSFFKETWHFQDDTYLFLITCDYSFNNGRLVIVAKSL